MHARPVRPSRNPVRARYWQRLLEAHGARAGCNHTRRVCPAGPPSTYRASTDADAFAGGTCILDGRVVQQRHSAAGPWRRATTLLLLLVESTAEGQQGQSN